MDTPGESVSVSGSPAAAELLRNSGYSVVEAPALTAIREGHIGLVVAGGADAWTLLSSIQALGPGVAPRVILLVATAEEKIRALDQAADAVLESDGPELLARVRAQLREHRAESELRAQARIADEGFHVAQTAFQALAVTEKMTKDAFSLERLLKFGAYGILAAAAVITVVLTLFTEHTPNQRAFSAVAQIKKRLTLMRGGSPRVLPEDPVATHRERIAEQSEAIRQQMAGAAPSDVAALRAQLAETEKHLSRIESEGRQARSIISSYAPSVCLVHVAVAFRDHFTGRHLHIDASKPQEKDKEPAMTLEDRGPEVRVDIFGTGFLAGPDGRILTNHHVAEPWWENEELQAAEKDNLEPVAVEMSAYFPNDAATYHLTVRKISPQADLAMMQITALAGKLDLSALSKRAIPQLDFSADAAESGEGVVLMGYATGLDAILARTSDAAAKALLESKSNTRDVMTELAKRHLIRPLVTQGHIGDILKDRIVYDAQTTSGGSGGPLFNAEGKVIGVNFAMLTGFGGSNFAIPIRFAEALLK